MGRRWVLDDEHLPHLPRVKPLVGQSREDPPVAGVGPGIQGGESHGPVVGLVQPATGARLGVGQCHDEVGPSNPDLAGDRTPQREAVLDDAVAEVVEELDSRHADLLGAIPLLLLTDRSRLVRSHRVDAGLAPRHEQVGHRHAGLHPLVDRGSCSVLEVVGVRGDTEDTLDARLVQGLKLVLFGHGPTMPGATPRDSSPRRSWRRQGRRPPRQPGNARATHVERSYPGPARRTPGW